MQQLKSDEHLVGPAIRCIYEGPYAAQLQLLRTLRPPKSKDMGGSSDGDSDKERRTSCRPPPYDASGDSFLVGPLRLFGYGDFHGDGEPRERTARLSVPGDGDALRRYWDVYHNVSPIDQRGHYLLLPALDDRGQWRDQSLTPNDCRDLTYLATTIDPPGSMSLSFNSANAGATQNHIHIHACVCPPPPLLGRADGMGHPSGYAATRAPPARTLRLDSGVTASLLDYPCTCIKLSARSIRRSDRAADLALKVMGDALTDMVRLVQRMDAPHNVTWTNDAVRFDNSQKDESGEAVALDAYFFFRGTEPSNCCDSGEVLGVGFSEMLGVFQSSSDAQLKSLGGNMARVLSDVSLEPKKSVWNGVCALGVNDA